MSTEFPEDAPIVDYPQDNMEIPQDNIIVPQDNMNTTVQQSTWSTIKQNDSDSGSSHSKRGILMPTTAPKQSNDLAVFGLILICFTVVLCLLGISAAIGYGGYETVQAGLDEQEYASTFNIKGRCQLESSHTTSRRSCSGTGSKRRCSTHYTTHTTWKVTDNYNSSMPCTLGNAFNLEESGHGSYAVGSTVTCYTNHNCAEVFTSTSNEHDANAGWIYFGASLVFLVACCFGCCFFVALYNHSVGIGKSACGQDMFGCNPIGSDISCCDDYTWYGKGYHTIFGLNYD
eukprot:251859_1